MPKLKTNENFIKWSWKKIINKKNKNLIKKITNYNSMTKLKIFKTFIIEKNI
jgi:hypothetical protein